MVHYAPTQPSDQPWRPIFVLQLFKALWILDINILNFFIKIFLGQCLYLSFFNTRTMHIKSIKHNSIAMFSLKTLNVHTLEGFEPGPSVREAHAMTTPPSHQGHMFLFFLAVLGTD
jgi:hypothetical protein